MITPANIQWSDDGQPFAPDFGDHYFSTQDGLAETRHVFLDGNKLQQRWSTADSHHFTIGEIGFGSGLNFIASWALWKQNNTQQKHLYYVSTELHPFDKHDLIRAAALWPELADLYQQLIDQYPPLTAGFHLLNFDGISLLLLLGDAQQMLCQLVNTKIDAWFLDGFAPSKNPELWTAELCQCIALLSKTGATVATFSAAGDVKRGLQNAGFSVEKQKGYGSKREMICARFDPKKNLTPNKQQIEQKYRDGETPWYISRHTNGTTKQVTIIGAGIAGCSIARSLTDKGFQVDLFDANSECATEASGNLQAVLYGRFSPHDDAFSQFARHSYLYATRYYHRLKQDNPQLPIHNCGVLQLGWNDKEQELHRELDAFCQRYPEVVKPVSADQASELAGITLQQGGLFFSQGGWLFPQAICKHLLQHPNITCHFNTEVRSIEQTENFDWHLKNQQGEDFHSCNQLVLACGDKALAIKQLEHLPLKTMRGQVSYLPGNPDSEKLKMVVCGNGYLAPVHEQYHSLGATYTPKNKSLQTTAEEHRLNLQQLSHQSPQLANQWQASFNDSCSIKGRAHFRTISPDFLPLCGPVPDHQAFIETFGKLQKDARLSIPERGHYLPGLYLLSALGSRGMSYAPLCAEVLASHITQGPPTLPLDVIKALNPARFVIRDLKKNRLTV